jgi:phosphatidylserine/phosphatidylglycerophosphate/cardiolipin synthase-like enzyme
LFLVLALVSGAGVAPARSAQHSGATTNVISVHGPGGTTSTLVALVNSAQHRLLIEAFALADPTVIGAVLSARHRGVDVRVMLDPAGLNTSGTLQQLQQANALTRLPNQGYAVSHLSFVVVDASTVVVGTGGFTSEALGPSGAAYLIVDSDRYDVLQAASLFYDDWLRQPVNHFSHHLLIFPDDTAALASLVRDARYRIELYTAYLSDTSLVQALYGAHGSGALVRVLTPRQSMNDALVTFGTDGAVRFSDQGSGTILVLDRHTALIGSMDFSGTTMTQHRELGVLIDDPAIVSMLDRSFFKGFDHAIPLRPRPVGKPEKRNKQPKGSAGPPLSATVTAQVRPGSEGVIVVTTAPSAPVHIAIAYPKGSTPATGTSGTDGVADKKGSFVYRWIVSGAIKAGTATVTVRAGRSPATTKYWTMTVVV